MEYLLLIVGFALLIKGADYFVEGSSDIARFLKIPSVIIGLTIVSMGTSAPEAAVSITAGLTGNNDIALGNIIGSNIFNLLVVVGVCAAIRVFKVDDTIFKRDFPICIGITVLLMLLAFDGSIALADGIILLALFVGYIALTVALAMKKRKRGETEVEMKKRKPLLSVIFIISGLAAVIFGGDLVVDNAVKIAINLGMSQSLVAMTIVAVGTSLPELVTSITAARKGDSGLALGNVVGSNIFNILFILGMSSALHPISVSAQALTDIYFCLGVTAAFYLACFNKDRKVGRILGVVCVLVYVAYTIMLIMR